MTDKLCDQQGKIYVTDKNNDESVPTPRFGLACGSFWRTESFYWSSSGDRMRWLSTCAIAINTINDAELGFKNLKNEQQLDDGQKYNSK